MTSPMKEKFSKLCAKTSRYGEKNDCTVKAVAITCRTSYENAHAACAAQGRRKGRGMYPSQYHAAIAALGYTVKPVKLSTKGKTAGNVGAFLKGGFYLVTFRGHVAAFHGSVNCDWTAGRRHRVKSVYKVVKCS